MSDELQLPPEFDPHDSQIPPGIGAHELDRWRLAFAIGRALLHRDSPSFVRALFESDIPTGNLTEKLNARPPEQ